jgi:diaminopimelate epimerase
MTSDSNLHQPSGNKIFAKAHALGNDFVLIKTNEKLNADQIRLIGNYKLGIGADQILVINDNLEVEIWNSEGSIAKMCMNGMRSLAKWVFSNQAITNSTTKAICLKTISGPVYLEQIDEEIKLTPPAAAKIEKQNNYYLVNVGNDHKIYILEDDPADKLAEFAQKEFNVSCIWKKDEKWNVRTWERGAQETLACGSAAFAIASVLDKLGETNLNIHYKLGVINHFKEDGNIVQIGPAHVIAQGELFL